MQIYMYEIILPGQESNHLYCGIFVEFTQASLTKKLHQCHYHNLYSKYDF